MSQLADSIITGPLVFQTVPTEKAAALIYVPGLGWMEWVEVSGAGAFQGYRTLRCGALEFGTTTAPRSYEADLVGGLGSKTSQASIWAWAQQNGHAVAASAWTTKVFKFADVDENNFRFPDLRDQFPRFSGKNVDGGAQRALGSSQLDALQNITGGFSVVGSTALVGGLFPGQNGAFYCPPDSTFSNVSADGQMGARSSYAGFDASRVARTSTETRPTNTAFTPRIHL